MIWWWRSRRLPVAGAALVVYLVLIGMSSGVTLPVPALSGAALPVPVGLLAPLILVIACAYALGQPLPIDANASARPVQLLDVGFASGLVLIGVFVSLLVGAMAVNPTGVAAGRNAVGYLGLTLLFRRRAGGEAAAIPAVAYALGACLLGRMGNGSVHTWAWPLAVSGSAVSWSIALAIALVGIGVHLWPPSKGLQRVLLRRPDFEGAHTRHS